VAMKYTGPAPTRVIAPVLELIVATAVLLLSYVIAPPPVAAPLGAAVIEADPTIVANSVTENIAEENADVARDTVNVLLSIVALVYVLVDACVAVKYTDPAPTRVIAPVLEIVATAVLLLVYVIAPPLALLGVEVIETDPVMVAGLVTAKVDSVGVVIVGAIDVSVSMYVATPRPMPVKMEVPAPVQVIPSVEYAMLFVPLPNATHRDNAVLYTTSLP